MELSQALTIIKEATASVMADLPTHQKIQTAISVLEAKATTNICDHPEDETQQIPVESL